MTRLVLVVFLSLSAVKTLANNALSSIQLNNKGVESLKREDLVAAEQNFIQALAENPFNAIVHLNLGWTFEVQKKYDKALKENESVLRAIDLPDDLKFIARFNAGNAAAQAQLVDSAVQYYQAALDLKPDSKEVKTNIELLFKSGAGKGKGDGGGKGKDQSENEEGQGQEPNDKNKDQSEQNQKKEKPKFDSQNLTKEDVRKILEELKSQEQKIRALEYGTQGKEASPEKDW